MQRSESPRLWEMNEDDSPTYQHLWDTEKKTMLKGKFIAVLTGKFTSRNWKGII